MTANPKPEIELEVSCGGTFKISTDAMACKITVLESALAQQAKPAVQAAAPLPSVEPEVREVQVMDSFWADGVGSICDQVADVLGDQAASMDLSLEGAGSAAAMSALYLPSEAQTAVQQHLDEQAKALAKAQAKIVDQRFTLTFLKNHPIFSRRDPDAEEITVSSAELDKLHAKIKSAMQTAALINEALAEVKEKLGAGVEESEISASVAGLASAQYRMIEAFCRLAILQEEKEADPEVSFDDANATALDRLTALQESENGEQQTEEELDLSDQAAIDRLLNGATDDDASNRGEEEMSDEEALRKMQEFGL